MADAPETIADLLDGNEPLFIPAGGGPPPDPAAPPGPPAQPGPTAAAAIADGGITSMDVRRARRLVAEIASRRREALRLYEPLPIMERFHADKRKDRLLRGGNRAGKTLAAAVEMARAITGQDPHGKYPLADGCAAAVGLDGRHCGDPLYKLMFRPGAFKIIRDEVTGEWRAYRPLTDSHREAERKNAPPLVPKRMIEDISWEDKKRGIPAIVRMKNGWTLTFYSSRGLPPNGIQLDVLWIDEEIENELWWPEMVARLLDRRGRAYWSATPQVASEHLFNLHIRADDHPEQVGEYCAILWDNPHIPQEEKELLESRIVSDEERRVRILGEFALTGFKIYPEFSMAVHSQDLDGPLKEDWARFVVVDPGRQVCGVLFGAVPPPHLPPMLLLYDELYIKGCDAEMFGKSVAGKLDFVLPEAMIIDSHGGRITDIGSGYSVESQYTEALKRHAVACRTTGSGFVWGSDDVKAGILAVHDYLRIHPDGRPRLFIARGRLPKFEHEIARYHYRKINKQVSDEPEKKNDHLMDCLRYICSFRPSWHQPIRGKKTKNYAVTHMAEKLARKRARNEGGSAPTRLGPGR